MIFTLSKTGFEYIFKRNRIDTNFFQSPLLTNLELRDTVAFITDLFHIFPPLVGIAPPNKLLSDLLIKNQPSVGRLFMDIVDSAIGFIIVTVGCKTFWTFNVIVYKCQIDVVLDLGVEFCKFLYKKIGMTII